MALWAAACTILPWQSLLSELPLLRVVIAVTVFCAPGAALRASASDGGGTIATQLLFGFVASWTAVGLAGLGGSLLGLPVAGIRLLLVASGMAALGAGVARRRPRPRTSVSLDDVWTLTVLGLALLIGARLAFAPYVGGDDITHVARIIAFQQREHLGYQPLALGGDNVLPPRYWLSFWPLWQALLATLAAVHPLALTANHLGPILAAISLLAVYDLGRALGMTRRLATFGVTAQIALLLCLLARTRAGWIFFDRVAEDKFLAFFLLAPVALACLTRALSPTRGAGAFVRLACAWLALAFSHPTSLGMVSLVGAAYCGLEVVLSRSRRRAALCLTVVVVITAAAASVRLIPHPFFEKLERGPEARFAAVLEDENTRGRIYIIPGTGYFGVGADTAPPAAQLVGSIVLLIALWFARRDRTARLLVASLGIVGLAIAPHTGWLLGKALPPFHLWRIICLVPFGIAAAFVGGLATSAALRMRRVPPWLWTAARSVPTLLLVAVAILTLGFRATSLTSLDPPRGWREHVIGVRFDERKRNRVTYAEVEAMTGFLRRLVPPGAVVLGDGRTNNLLPSMSSSASLVCFRSVHQTMLHGELSREQAAHRCNGLKKLLAGKSTPEEALGFLNEHHVQFALLGGRSDWLDAIPAELLPRRILADAGTFRLYLLEPTEQPT